MALQRETLYAALFDALQSRIGAVAIKTYTRRVRDLDQLPVSQQPALVMLATGQTPEHQDGGIMQPRWFLDALVCVYCRSAPGDANGPEPLLHDLVGMVEDALAPPWTEQQRRTNTTLTGSVVWARIEGPITYYHGAEGDQAEAQIPVRMLALI